MDARYAAFVEEFEKLAAEVVRTRSALESHLKPGDILVTTNAPTHHGGSLAGRVADRVLKFGIRTVYGDAGHAAIYTGDGKTVEMSNKLKHWDLSRSTRGKDVHVFRPDADTKTRKAVARALVLKAEEQGKSIRYVPPSTLAKALVEEFMGRKVYDDKTSPAGEDQRYTCTNVIAAAYKDHGVDLAPKKTVALVSPTDFITSDRTTKVVSYINPLRHDRERRRGIEEHEKAAEDVSTTKALVAKARPGDIIITSQGPITPDPKRTAFGLAVETAFDALNRNVNGVDSTHSSMYVGDGKAVELVSSGEVRIRPVSRVVTVRDARLLRPSVTASEGRAAARKMVDVAERGEMGYASAPWIAQGLLSYTPLKGLVHANHDADLKKNRATCSNLIATSYKGKVKFHGEKPVGYITPKDLLESKNTTEVARLVNKKRWDIERRGT